MTNENPLLKASLENARPNTTVFSDGSTFDYENGYQSNGVVPSRNRDEKVRIVKHGEVVSSKTLLSILTGIIAALVLSIIVIGLVKTAHNVENQRAIEGVIKISGAAEVIKKTEPGTQETLVVRNKQDQSPYVCNVEYVNEGVSTALVFCSPGAPATFSIPLPYDPTNIFYTTPKLDS